MGHEGESDVRPVLSRMASTNDELPTLVGIPEMNQLPVLGLVMDKPAGSPPLASVMENEPDDVKGID